VATTIGVNRRPVGGFRHRLNGGIQHRVDEFGIWAGSNGPAHHHPIEAIDDGRQVHLASRDLELRDVSEPLLIERCGLEVSVDDVLRRCLFSDACSLR
jgi:hypothetical protein